MSEETYLPEAIKPASNQKPLLVTGVVALIILLSCCLLFVGVLLFVDPLNLQILDRLSGSRDAAAEGMPEDTVMYMGVDLLNITPEKFSRVLTPFQDLLTEETGALINTLDDLMTQLDTDVLSELDMTFAEDIQPWIGQYIGLGLVDFQTGEYGDLESVDYIVSVEARNKKAADAFLEKLKTKLTENSGQAFLETEYRGVTISELIVPNQSESIALARSGSLVLFSNQSRNLKRAIDGQAEASLAAEPVFKQIVGKLPKDRILSVYFSGARLTELLYTSSVEFMGAGAAQSTRYLKGLAMSVSIVDEGVQLDTWTAYDPEAMSEEQKAMFAATGEKLELVKLLPAGTVFYAGGTHLDLVWSANKALLGQSSGMGEDLSESMELFAQQFGFNPDTDLFPYLDDEWGLVVIPAEDGILEQQMHVGMGLMFAADTSDAAQSGGVVDQFATSLEAIGAPVEEITVGDATFKQVLDPMMGSLFTFGVSDNRLVIATSSGVVGMLTEDQETLVKSDRYQQAVDALPRGLNPVLYLDLEKMLTDIRSTLSAEFLSTFEESVTVLQPIQYVVAGGSAIQDDLGHNVVIIFIESK